jgi:hypothetical protein
MLIGFGVTLILLVLAAPAHKQSNEFKAEIVESNSIVIENPADGNPSPHIAVEFFLNSRLSPQLIQHTVLG